MADVADCGVGWGPGNLHIATVGGVENLAPNSSSASLLRRRCKAAPAREDLRYSEAIRAERRTDNGHHAGLREGPCFGCGDGAHPTWRRTMGRGDSAPKLVAGNKSPAIRRKQPPQPADLDAIRIIGETVSIPVISNGSTQCRSV